MSSPLINCCKSSVKLFGATYSAHAASIDLAMKDDSTGIFMTFGRDFARGMTEIEMRGSPINVTRADFILGLLSDGELVDQKRELTKEDLE